MSKTITIEERLNKLEERVKKLEAVSVDPVFEEVVKVISEYDKVSPAFLQRRFQIGYARAAQLMDEL